MAMSNQQNINPFFLQDQSETSTSSPHANKTPEDRRNRTAKDNHAVSKRLQKELMTLMMSSEKGVSAFPEGENLFKWVATIRGPESTVFEGKTFKLSLEFPTGYPYSAPTVKFTTACFHPNVDPASGNICIDILKENWSASYDIRTILLSIQSLLGEPNNDSPLNPEAAEMWPNQVKYKARLEKAEEEEKAVKKQVSSQQQNQQK